MDHYYESVMGARVSWPSPSIVPNVPPLITTRLASKVTESKQSQPNFIVIYRFLIGYVVGILYFD